MSMNKTCPISNFTSDPDGMASFYVETEVLRVDCGPRHSFSSARDLVNVAPLQLGEEVSPIHDAEMSDRRSKSFSIVETSRTQLAEIWQRASRSVRRKETIIA